MQRMGNFGGKANSCVCFFVTLLSLLWEECPWACQLHDWGSMGQDSVLVWPRLAFSVEVRLLPAPRAVSSGLMTT